MEVKTNQVIIIGLILLAAIFVAGCTVSNTYHQIKVKEKFSTDARQFIITNESEVISVGRFCYYDHVKCYNVFAPEEIYIIKLGVEDNVFERDDIIITDIIRVGVP